jgi:hypothetical protein
MRLTTEASTGLRMKRSVNFMLGASVQYSVCSVQ